MVRSVSLLGNLDNTILSHLNFVESLTILSNICGIIYVFGWFSG